jgi:predicted ATPase/DNA-binding XRE family transcriptional regulator
MKDSAFGELLREFRSAAGLSQEALAERARLSPGAISTLERSTRRAPQHQTLALLAEALRLNQTDRARLEAAAAIGRRRGTRTVAEPAGPAALNNLPNVLTSFHGRDRDLAELEHLITERRLVTLLGTGGVGKTRLALETARRHAETASFPDGIWLVELAPLGSPALVTAAIAHVLGVREQSHEPFLDTLVTAIGSKRLLILLDNCEHLIEECARVAERLSRDCPGAIVLATTREALRIDGELIVRVEPLAFENDEAAGPALDLFTDRLVAADYARFSEMTADDRTHAATICRRLDGIPLALELAAGRARELSLAQIVAGLDERFALLSRGRRTALPRQHTLRGMIDWSFALLLPAEQELFARLGLFAGSFTPEAASEICGDRPATVRDALAALIAKSLVTVVEDREGRLRYRLLETVRTYARDRLAEGGDLDRCAARFARYFCATAKEADGRYGRISNRDFLASVEPDLDNFRAALDWSLGRGNDPLLGAELAGAMGWVYRQNSLFAEGARWCEKALDEVAGLGDAVAGRLHMALSFFSFNMGEMSRALDAAERATDAYTRAGTPSDVSWSLTQQSYCLYLLGRSEESREAVIAAIGVAREQQDSFRLAGALNAFALTIPVERAAERFAPLEEAIRCYRAAGDDAAIVPIANLAEAHYATGDFDAAFLRGLEVVAMTRKNRDRSNLAAALTNVAAYALTLGDVQQARDAAHEALAMVRDLGKTLNAMCALQHLGSVSALQGEYARAALLSGASNRLYDEFRMSREFTEQSLYDRTVDRIREVIGDDELQRFLGSGASMPFEQAVDEALAVDESASHGWPAAT